MIKVSLVASTGTCLTESSLLSCFQKTPSQPACLTPKWHSSWLPLWTIPSEKDVRVFTDSTSYTRVVTQTWLSDGLLKVDSCASSSRVKAVEKERSRSLRLSLSDLETCLLWRWWVCRTWYVFPEGTLTLWVPVPWESPERNLPAGPVACCLHQIPCFGEECKHRPDFHFKRSQAYCSQQMPSDSICPPGFWRDLKSNMVKIKASSTFIGW